MKVEKFEDLEVWKESMNLSILIYRALIKCKDFSLRDQIQRSSVSIPSNIAEGFGRESNKEYIRFLVIAQGSCAELRTQLYIAKEVGIIKKDKADDFLERTKKISSMLYRFIQARKQF